EAAAAAVLIEAADLRRVHLRAAESERISAATVARDAWAPPREGAEIEIEPAVIVDVAPGGALAPVREMDPATRRRVAEAPALVVVERADAVAGEAEIGAAVVIVIAGAGTDPVARALEAGGAGHVAEAVALVPVEAALRSAHQQQVEPAVAIVVDEGAPRAIRVEQV